MLKDMPMDALKTFDKTLLYTKKTVRLLGDNDRHPNNDNFKNIE